MKYLTFNRPGRGKPVVVMFSPSLEHAVLAELLKPLGELLGAGFVSISSTQVHVAGFATSVFTGPAAADNDAIAFDLETTLREYPAHPETSVADAFPATSRDELSALRPEEQAAMLGTKAPLRCQNCGKALPATCTYGAYCHPCHQLMHERAFRAHSES
jgi:hypothetical protein